MPTYLHYRTLEMFLNWLKNKRSYWKPNDQVWDLWPPPPSYVDKWLYLSNSGRKLEIYSEKKWNWRAFSSTDTNYRWRQKKNAMLKTRKLSNSLHTKKGKKPICPSAPKILKPNITSQARDLDNFFHCSNWIRE
jgi:hypothetical protein